MSISTERTKEAGDFYAQVGRLFQLRKRGVSFEAAGKILTSSVSQPGPGLNQAGSTILQSIELREELGRGQRATVTVLPVGGKQEGRHVYASGLNLLRAKPGCCLECAVVRFAGMARLTPATKEISMQPPSQRARFSEWRTFDPISVFHLDSRDRKRLSTLGVEIKLVDPKSIK